MTKRRKKYKGPPQYLKEKAEAFCKSEWGLTLQEVMLIRLTCMYSDGYYYVEPSKSTNKKPYNRTPQALIDAGVLKSAGMGCARRYVPDPVKVAHYLSLADQHGLIYPEDEEEEE